MIHTFGNRKGLSEQDLAEILRHANFESKSGWILRLLGVRRVSESHRTLMREVMERRNAFMHYKWKLYDADSDDWDEGRADLKSLVASAEKTVRYLQKFENEQVFGGRKRAILEQVKFSDACL